MVLLVACVFAAGCETATITPGPGSPGASAGSALESGRPFETGDAFSSAIPGGLVEQPIELPLPEPTLVDPFAIGEALYDPSRMADAVVSLLDLMGVGIYARDGTLIRRGDEHAAGDPWLYDSEVRGLIAMGIADVLDGGDDGPKRSLADLYALLTPLLPEVSHDAFIAAYRDSYAAHPDDLVPMVMLGQPLDESARFTNTQMWLLFMDGFVELAQPPAARMEPGVLLARAGSRPNFSTANARLPPLNLPTSMTARDWQELEAHLWTAWTWAKMDAFATAVAHEGHGGTGRPVRIIARIKRPTSIVSAVDGRVLVAATNGPLDGIPVDFLASNNAWQRHGSLSPPFSTSANAGQLTTDASGEVAAVFTPKKEVANGHGEVAAEPIPIRTFANGAVLFARAYVVTDQRLAAFLTSALQYGQFLEEFELWVEWHQPGIQVTISNSYDVTVAPETGGLVARAHRKGVDQFFGVLTRRDDGTYRGTMHGSTSATAQMEFVAGVAGTRCEDETKDFHQELQVVARVAPTPPIDPNIEVIAPGDPGRFDGGDLILSFYPTSPPSGTPGKCQGVVEYFGPGPDGARMSGEYASFNDSHWTDPSLGFRIHLPSSGDLRYTNLYWNLPSMGASSTFLIIVSRDEGA
jgi:hypothetical protein